MKSNFQRVGRRAWAAILAALMVLTTVAGSVTLPAKTAKAGEDSVLIDSNFANLATTDAETGWWLYDAQNDGNWANCAATITAEGAGLNIDYTGNYGGFYDALWGIQVPQMMTVEAGVPYTFSFDVTSTGTKGIKAKVDGMESVLDSDFTAVAGTQTFTVENVTFDTAGTVKFLFALGWVDGDDSAVEITISNVTMTPPPVEEDYGIIVDGDFENLASAEVTEGWWIYDAQNDGNWAGCAADITATGDGLNLNYTGNYGGFYDALWGIQVPQWINVEAGVSYTLSFDVESTGTKGIKIKVDGKESILDSDFTAAAGTQTFTVENVVFDTTGTEKLLFALGWMSGDDAVADVTISNVKMIPAQAAPEVPETPTVADIIVDGNFEALAAAEVTEGWWLYDGQAEGNWANCAATITATGEGLELDYTGNYGGFYDAIWGIQVPQWINVEAGVPYTLSFDVESTGTKGIKVKVEGQEAVLDKEYTATAGTQTFTVENVVFDTTGALKLLFALGWMSGDDSVVNVKISNVTMTYEDSAETPEQPEEPGVTDPIPYPGKTVEEMAEAGYTLVWSDEFDGDSLDLTKWDYQIGNGQTATGNSGWGNQEGEYYTNSENNVKVSDGYLTITALKETVTDPAEGTFYYTSGRIRTTSDVNGQLFATKYGRIEAQMKLPTEEGAWPAFWMLPQDQSIYNGWAASGELDIMEGYGDKPNVIGGTIHYGSQWPNNIYKGKSYYFDNTTDTSVFHTYGVEWEPGKITWFVDDEEYYTADTWYSINSGAAENTTFDAPFDVPFYILLNVAVNGTWDAGEADNGDYTGNGNSSMVVDYVRVYSKEGVDYDNPNPPSASGGATDADAYMEYVYPLCGDNYQGFNFVQDDAFNSLKEVAVVEPTDSDWQFYVGDFGGAATCSVTDGVANVDITSAGSQTYAIQLIKHMPMLKGYNYKVTFDAYADADRNITVHPSGDADNGWAGYAAETIALTTENSTYSFSFNMGNDSDPTARLEFNLGSAGTANVHISNVKVEMVEKIETDDTVTKNPLANGNLIWNGSFSEGDGRLAYWTIQDNASVVVPNFVDYVVNSSDHVVRNDRTGVNENYERRAIVNGEGGVVQSGLTLKQSDQYRLTFEAYTAEEGQMVEAMVYGADTYGFETFDLVAGSENKYELVFAMPYGVTDSDVSVRLYNCNGGEIQLDDVQMYAITNNNSEMDYSEVVTEPVPDNSDGFYINYYTAGNDPAVPDADGVYTIQTWKDTNNYQSMFLHEVQMTEGIDYVLTFDAKSDVENTYEVSIQQDNTWAMAWGPQTFTTGTEWDTYTFNFTSALSTAGGEVTFLKYLLTSCENTSNLYMRNISLKAVLPEVDGIGDAPEGTAVLESDVITEGEDAVIVLADNAWTQKFLELSDTYGAVVMVDANSIDYTALPALIDGNKIVIDGYYLYAGDLRIELALNGYYNIVLPLTVEAAEAPVVDKSQLEATIEGCQNTAEDDYTAESYAAFVEAYNAAAAVLADPDATQEEVDAADAALKAAIDALVPVGGLTPDEGGETGDFHAYLYVLLMVAALGAGAIALYDRKKRA